MYLYVRDGKTSDVPVRQRRDNIRCTCTSETVQQLRAKSLEPTLLYLLTSTKLHADQKTLKQINVNIFWQKHIPAYKIYFEQKKLKQK